MDSVTESWSDVIRNYKPKNSINGTKSEQDVSRGKLTYGGFISMLQSLGVNHNSARGHVHGMPIGKGGYFLVYRHSVSPSDYQAMGLAVSIPRKPLFQRPSPDINTYVAVKRVKVNEQAAEIDVSDQGQLHAIYREITALVHPRLRDHDSIIKLQAIIWEDGLSHGSKNKLPMWPSLVMEYCDTTLAEYQLHNPPIARLQRGIIGSKIGQGLDALHSANIFHGDLKSENVLLKVNRSGTLEPKLADFGCSVTFLDEEGKTRYWVAGTPMWWAPECPNYFTTIEDIEATDCYSFALLLLRMHADGRNPFEEFGVIPAEWSPEDKLCAVQFLKETDCVSALICGNEDLESLPPEIRLLAVMLLKDPAKRISAMSGIDPKVEDLLSIGLQETESVTNVSLLQKQLDKLSLIMENSRIEPESCNTDSLAKEESEIPDPLSLISTYLGKAFVPDCARLSKVNSRAAFNAATRARVFQELSLILEENGTRLYPKKCLECCRLSIVDTDPQTLTPETLIQEMQQHLQNPRNGHTCQGLIGSDISPRDLEISQAIYGGMLSPASARKSAAVMQLFLATASGFGTQKDPHRALKILEDATTSGFTGYRAFYYLYSIYTNQLVNPNLPLRTWLVSMVLFSDGIPSNAFSALMKLDPALAELAKRARSKVYNGSTASFNNLRFNSLHPRDSPRFDIPPGFFKPEAGPYPVQDELFENTLLHLAAGSDGGDVSMISYCINVLNIDKNVRNAGGATPLLLACRAGREDKILALLELGASVNLSYEGGETPLHWLGLLPDQSRALDEFLKRDADINAQVNHPRLLPNYIDGTRGFFLAAGPLVWAMAMESQAYVDALLRRGADIHYPGPTGLTAINIACRPRLSKFLARLSKEKAFKVTRTDAYNMLINWSEMEMIIRSVTHKEQEEALELILSTPDPFKNLEEVHELYRYLIPKSVSECRIEILEIVLKGLSRSIGAIQFPDQDLDYYVKSPLSHPFWVHHYFVHEAATRGDVAVLEAVLREGGDAAAIDGFGRTALHMLSSCSDNPDCVDLLISNGALEILDHRFDLQGWTAFTSAVAHCNFQVADRLLFYTQSQDRKILLSSHAAPGMGIPGVSMIGHFIAWSHLFGEKPLEYLFNLPEISNDPDSVFIVDETNSITVFKVACGIYSEGAIYDAEFFATSRRRRAYGFLVQKFPETHYINAKDNYRNTALHVAAWTGNSDMATTLMDSGAELSLPNDSGASPLDILFAPDPPYLLHERESKKMMIENFEKGRNDIYMELKSRGGTHSSLAVNDEGTTNMLPRPQS